ncbi:hypothetical protein A2U01_0115465, partial [Trifolium medium]|nr:hypothetical protein [Trifolium medium]
SRRDYNLYNAKICMDFADKAANASTQTKEKSRQRMEWIGEVKDLKEIMLLQGSLM